RRCVDNTQYSHILMLKFSTRFTTRLKSKYVNSCAGSVSYPPLPRIAPHCQSALPQPAVRHSATLELALTIHQRLKSQLGAQHFELQPNPRFRPIAAIRCPADAITMWIGRKRNKTTLCYHHWNFIRKSYIKTILRKNYFNKPNLDRQESDDDFLLNQARALSAARPSSNSANFTIQAWRKPWESCPEMLKVQDTIPILLPRLNMIENGKRHSTRLKNAVPKRYRRTGSADNGRRLEMDREEEADTSLEEG
ncbi:unnamed protein product, partial [Nesidiocoris tenuis]